MAERRMFAKTIVDSDSFLDMPLTAQALYFHLAMRADDDGFVNSPKKIQRMIQSKPEDMKCLEENNFILPFENGVVVIRHWRIHNQLRPDRYKETVYTHEKKQLILENNGAYSLNKDFGIPNGNQTETQYSIVQDSIGEDIIDNTYAPEVQPSDAYSDKCVCEPEEYIKVYNDICDQLPKVQRMTDSRRRAIREFEKQFTIEDFRKICQKANESDFLTGKTSKGNWKADISYLLKQDVAVKALEGGFDNGSSRDPFLAFLDKEANKKVIEDPDSHLLPY